MQLEEAKESFTQLLARITNATVCQEFFQWVSRNAVERLDEDDRRLADADTTLRRIAADLREVVGITGLLYDEVILPPATLDVAHTVHVDSFICDDDLMDELFEAGQLERYYCRNCASRDIKSLQILSHSTSRERLEFIFRSLLPPLDGKKLVDIGSRLGAILYGAYVHSNVRNATGIELNFKFCQYQTAMINKYGMDDRLKVLCGDVMTMPEVIRGADIVILNNVFEFFIPKADEIRCWNFLKHNLRRSGTLLLAIPDLRTTLTNLRMDSHQFLDDWVSQMPLDDITEDLDANLQAEIADMTLYTVL